MHEKQRKYSKYDIHIYNFQLKIEDIKYINLRRSANFVATVLTQ